ncbi:MAG: iron-sulfur cluster assembly scaffold protein [Blastocatellia bacterium]
MSFYPLKIHQRFLSPVNTGKTESSDAAGTAASFECGSFVRIFLWVDAESKGIANVRFLTNGCGFMIAAADVIADYLKGKRLSDLHGLSNSELGNIVADELDSFPSGRTQCRNLVLDALRSTFAEYRARVIEEFTGEKALICTCFGVTEETIINVINETHATNIDEVSAQCNAGSGCGSCQMLIRELIYSAEDRL